MDNAKETIDRLIQIGGEWVKESGIFTVDFSEVPGFIPAVAKYLKDIEELGMAAALKKFLA